MIAGNSNGYKTIAKQVVLMKEFDDYNYNVLNTLSHKCYIIYYQANLSNILIVIVQRMSLFAKCT
jgi:hypothetical protein